jgi:hypothetical protein
MYKNFMKHDFKNYYAPDGKGDYKKVSRTKCVEYDKDSFAGSYPQRWYWDTECGFVIRLERNAYGERIYNEARSERRRQQKAALEQSGCVFKECLDCKGWDKPVGDETQCDNCTKHITFISLDEELDTESGDKSVRLELNADTDVHRQAESSYLLELLHYELATFSNEERELWEFMVAGTPKGNVAKHFGWTLDKLSYRQLKLRTKIRSNPALSNFFEKS